MLCLNQLNDCALSLLEHVSLVFVSYRLLTQRMCRVSVLKWSQILPDEDLAPFLNDSDMVLQAGRLFQAPEKVSFKAILNGFKSFLSLGRIQSAIAILVKDLSESVVPLVHRAVSIQIIGLVRPLLNLPLVQEHSSRPSLRSRLFTPPIRHL